MGRKSSKKHSSNNHHDKEDGTVTSGGLLKDIILGGQDGLVNVLGIVLGVAAATGSSRVVIISGLAGTFAESLSMAAVAYTSQKAARDYYYSELEREKREIKSIPNEEKQEIRQIYYQKGFRGSLLSKVVKKITSSKRLWLKTMMAEELRMFPDDYAHPGRDAWIVGLASFAGSLIPLVPFFLMQVNPAIAAAILTAALILFATGALKARMTVGNWFKAGIEMMLIGMIAALGGYAIGAVMGAMLIG